VRENADIERSAWPVIERRSRGRDARYFAMFAQENLHSQSLRQASSEEFFFF